MSAIDRVRIMVLGDSGVGKTSFTHLAANNEPIRAPGWTIGCNVEVKLHEYKEGTPGQTRYFVELWDVGGSSNHRNARGVFYSPCHGVILVHDLTNRKSEENLRKWLQELLASRSNIPFNTSNLEDADMENFVGVTQIPILMIGTMLDLVDERSGARVRNGLSSSGLDAMGVAAQFGAEEILLDCRQKRYIAAGTSNAVKVSRFYDKVIEKRYHSNESSVYDERSIASPNLSSKFYSPVASMHQD